MDKIEHLIYWMQVTSESEAVTIDCEDGASKFVSMGHMNGYVNRIKKAIRDDSYFNHLMLSVDPDNATEWK